MADGSDLTRIKHGIQAPAIVLTILAQLFVVYVAANMALCAVVFAPWAKPRETISGLLGRWQLRGTLWQQRFAAVAGWLVNRLYFWEPNHCIEVYVSEENARRVLYP